MKTKLMIVAGEASADLHAAALVHELKKSLSHFECFGVGGNLLREEGMRIDVAAESLSIVGLAEIGKIAGAFGSLRKLVRLAKEETPAAAILLDLPDFNLMLAKRLKRLGIPVIYYISPQVWAWRRYRIKTIKRTVDRMLVLFPFEKKFYDEQGVSSEFVGHPLLDVIQSRTGSRPHAEVASKPRIALLPGSRTNEVLYHCPILHEVIKKVRASYPQAEFTIPVAPTLKKEFIAEHLKDDSVSYSEKPAQEVLRWADVAIVASGTATLETALVGTPFCLFYEVHPFNAWFLRSVAKYKGLIGMPNLLLGKQVVQEFFQEAAKPELIAAEMIRLVGDETYRATMTGELQECRKGIACPAKSGESEGASVNAARSVREFLSSFQTPPGGSLEGTLQPA